jgi:hypothetical protein
MTSRDFCYWLQGYLEMTETKGLMEHQVECLQKHLALVFAHEIDPSMGPKPHQDNLNKIHSKPPFPSGGGDLLLRC